MNSDIKRENEEEVGWPIRLPRRRADASASRPAPRLGFPAQPGPPREVSVRSQIASPLICHWQPNRNQPKMVARPGQEKSRPQSNQIQPNQIKSNQIKSKKNPIPVKTKLQKVNPVQSSLIVPNPPNPTHAAFNLQKTSLRYAQRQRPNIDLIASPSLWSHPLRLCRS